MFDQQGNRTETVDSLVANEFAVEIDGERVPGIMRIAHFVSFRLMRNGNVFKNVYEPFVITKMVQRDANNKFNTWLLETRAAAESSERPMRTLAILALDDHIETRRWTITNAYITEISYTDFNSASGEMIEEVLSIMYEKITETFPAS